MREIIDVMLLIALGVGYIVFYYAKREEKLLQITGYLIGMLIILIATFYITLNFLFQTRLFEPRVQKTYGQGMIRHRIIPPPASVPSNR